MSQRHDRVAATSRVVEVDETTETPRGLLLTSLGYLRYEPASGSDAPRRDQDVGGWCWWRYYRRGATLVKEHLGEHLPAETVCVSATFGSRPDRSPDESGPA
jgi:hypothetical protein